MRCPGSPGLKIPPVPCRPPKQLQADSAPAPGVCWMPKRHRQLSITETDHSPSPAFCISASDLPGGLDTWMSSFNPPQSRCHNGGINNQHLVFAVGQVLATPSILTTPRKWVLLSLPGVQELPQASEPPRLGPGPWPDPQSIQPAECSLLRATLLLDNSAASSLHPAASSPSAVPSPLAEDPRPSQA